MFCLVDGIVETKLSFNQCDQIWRNSTTLAINLRIIRFWSKFLTHFGTICMLLGKFFIAENGLILKTQSDHPVTLQINLDLSDRCMPKITLRVIANGSKKPLR